MNIISKLFLSIFLISRLHCMESQDANETSILTNLPKVFVLCMMPKTEQLITIEDYKKAIKEFHRGATPLLLTCKKFSQLRDKLTSKFIVRLIPGICNRIILTRPANHLAANEFMSVAILLINTPLARHLLIKHFTKFFLQILLSVKIQDEGELSLRKIQTLIYTSTKNEVSHIKDESSDNREVCPFLDIPNEIMLKIFLYNLDQEKIKESFLDIIALTQSCKQFFNFKKILLSKLKDLMIKDIITEKFFEALVNRQLNLCYIFLMSNKVNIHRKYPLLYYGTPLIIAAHFKAASIAYALILQGADINAKDDLGRDALYFAIARNLENLAKKLIEKNIDINVTYCHGNTALILAIMFNQQNIARLLIEKGADIYAKNDGGETALDIAKKYQEVLIIRILEAIIQEDEEVTRLSKAN